MQPVDIVNQFYLEYGNDEAACARAYLNSNTIEKKTGRQIKTIGVYYPVMNRGGVQRVISLLLPLYEKMGYKIVLITEEESIEDYAIPDSVKRYIITRPKDILDGIVTYKKRAEELEEIFRTKEIDIFIHHGVRLPFFVYDLILAKQMGIYTVAEKHQVFTQGFCDINDLFFMQKEAFKIVDKLIVLSNTEVNYWRSLGIDAVYIENPFNSVLLDVKCDCKEKNIVWAGRLDVNSKQYLDIVDIAECVIEKVPEAKFLLYGSGSSSDVEALECAIKAKSLTENVIFCGYESDVRKIYENARIHMVTSAYEAFPMGIYESRICGIPLVMYELPYLELLKEKKGYLAVPNRDIHGMADNICRILNEYELEQQLCKEAKESIAVFDNDLLCNKWKNLFNEIESGIRDVVSNEEVAVILQTMHKHFGIAQKKYERLLWKYEQEKVLYHVNKGLKAGKQIVVCPYGNVGKRIKKMLNEKGIYESYIMDNNLAQYHDDIVSFDDIKELDCSEMLFVICSELVNIRQLFYNKISKLTETENIIFYDSNL